MRSTVRMSRLARAIVALALSALAVGCALGSSRDSLEAIMAEQRAGSPERKVIRSGELVVTVADPAATSSEVERLVREAGGYVEQSTAVKDARISLECRVPAAQLERIMDAIAALGSEERRSVRALDVTEQYSDLETRLRNDRALRDRLQGLLARAKDVEDVLAIEKELNRIQSEIETMQAQLDRLKSQVELSALSVTLERRRILGPLGYASYGLWWALSKLFVIR